MTRVAACTLVGWYCALTACGGNTALSPCDIREPSCQFDVFLAVQDVRGSIWDPWIEPPPMKLVSETQYLAEEIARRERALQQQGGVNFLIEGLKLLRVVDSTETLVQATTSEVTNRAAFYDTMTHSVTIIDRGETGTHATDVRTLAHELVHAAQDRDFLFGSLGQLIASTDNINAISALVEGEAEMYAFLVDAKQLNISASAIDWHVFDNSLANIRSQTFVSRSPYRDATMYLPYPLGCMYSAEAYVAGGPLEVRRMYDAPPLSAAQFITARGGPDVVRTTSWTCDRVTPPGGFEMQLSDELGALALYAFATRFSSTEAEAWGHARSWTGDRFYVYTPPDDEAALAAVWLVRCADAGAAASLKAALAGFAEPLQTFVRGDTLHLLATKSPLAEPYDAWMRCDRP
jgi:hypothetical protein